jgi:HEAT repeat protein
MFGWRFLSWLGLEPGEAPLVLSLTLPYFMLGLAISFFETAAFAIFLVNFSAQTLSSIYVINAAVLIVVTLIFLRLSRQASLAGRITGSLVFLIVLALLFWLGVVRAGSAAGLMVVVFLLPVGSETIKGLIKTGYWGAAIRVFDLRQGKRLFGLMGSGRWVAFMVAGLLTQFIVSRLGVESLLLLAALAISVALPLMLLTLRRLGGQAVTGRPPEWEATATKPRPLSSYAWIIFGLIFIWFLASFVIDNIFYDRTTYRFPDEQELAAFLGLFSFVRGAATLLVTLFVSRAVTRRFGLRTSILILPVLVLILSVLMLVAAGLTQVNGVLPAAGAVFGLAVVLKLVDKAIGDSDEQATLSILYQPLSIAERDRAQVLGTGVVKPLAIGTVGVLLLALNALFDINGFALTYLVVGLAVLWIVIAWFGGRRYLREVSSAVMRRRLSGLVPELADAAGIRFLKQLLDSPEPQKALYALRVLAELDAYEHLQATVRAMSHPLAAIRLAALAQAPAVVKRLDSGDVVQLLTATDHLATADPDGDVQGRALLTLAIINPGPAVAAQAFRAMRQPADGRQTGTLAAILLLSATRPDVIAPQSVETLLDECANDVSPIVLEAAAQTPADSWATPSPIRDLLAVRIASSLASPHTAERLAALRAAGVVRHDDLWLPVIHLLEEPQTSTAAQSALYAGGSHAVAALATHWQPALPVKVQARLAQTLGQMGTAEALALLATHANHPQPVVRTQVLRALSRTGYPLSRETLESLLTMEAEDAAWALSAVVDLERLQDQPDNTLALLSEPLESYVAASQTRILYLLAMIYDRRLVLEGQRAFDQARRLGGRHEARERLAYALESLDLLLEPGHKRVILPVLESNDPARARDSLRAWFPELCRPMSAGERLDLIMTQSGPRGHDWLRATAIYLAAKTGQIESRDHLVAASFDPNPIVRETAAWALLSLDGGAQPNPHFLIVEKTLLLKRVPLFREVQNAVLAELATGIEELVLPAGTTLFHEGDAEDSFSVIGSGGIRIHSGDETLNELGPLAVFGEMAALTGQPRSASATTSAPTRLLRLDRHVLDEMIDENPHSGISIIQVLAGYLRHRVADLVALQAENGA